MNKIKHMDLGDGSTPIPVGHYHFGAISGALTGNVSEFGVVFTFGDDFDTSRPFHVKVSVSAADNRFWDATIRCGFDGTTMLPLSEPAFTNSVETDVTFKVADADGDLVLVCNMNPTVSSPTIHVETYAIGVEPHRIMTSKQLNGALPTDLCPPFNTCPTVLTSKDYGTTLPDPGTKGRIFFLEIQE